MNFKHSRLLTFAATAIVIATSTSAFSYNMSAKGEVHEGLTKLAEKCLSESTTNPPASCDTSRLENIVEENSHDHSDTERAARWPDDPTNTLISTGSISFAYDMTRGCEKRLKKIGGDPSRGGELGLLCQSHYGGIQYLHAMASKPGESRETTHNMMTDWARLNFRVATGTISSSQQYCAYLDDPATGLDAIKDSLNQAINPKWCDARPKRFLGLFSNGTWPAWRVHTLYTMECRNPFKPSVCNEVSGAEGDAMARKHATGAILHMVQDSYSLSHAFRGTSEQEQPDPLIAEARCAPVRLFHEYSKQVAAGIDHGAADETPTIICETGSPIHDPVTASANVLWHINKGKTAEDPKEWEDKLVNYLTQHVIGESL